MSCDFWFELELVALHFIESCRGNCIGAWDSSLVCESISHQSLKAEREDFPFEFIFERSSSFGLLSLFNWHFSE
jgi:hypothetical protein